MACRYPAPAEIQKKAGGVMGLIDRIEPVYGCPERAPLNSPYSNRQRGSQIRAVIKRCEEGMGRNVDQAMLDHFLPDIEEMTGVTARWFLTRLAITRNGFGMGQSTYSKMLVVLWHLPNGWGFVHIQQPPKSIMISIHPFLIGSLHTFAGERIHNPFQSEPYPRVKLRWADEQKHKHKTPTPKEAA